MAEAEQQKDDLRLHEGHSEECNSDVLIFPKYDIDTSPSVEDDDLEEETLVPTVMLEDAILEHDGRSEGESHAISSELDDEETLVTNLVCLSSGASFTVPALNPLIDPQRSQDE